MEYKIKKMVKTHTMKLRKAKKIGYFKQLHEGPIEANFLKKD